jgi:hypothetical protein
MNVHSSPAIRAVSPTAIHRPRISALECVRESWASERLSFVPVPLALLSSAKDADIGADDGDIVETDVTELTMPKRCERMSRASQCGRTSLPQKHSNKPLPLSGGINIIADFDVACLVVATDEGPSFLDRAASRIPPTEMLETEEARILA